MEPANITVKGAREHNLQNVSLSLPRNKLICLTGVSGSGKSSFAFDTLFAEGQRRYLESLSAYARQFMGQLARPDVDQVTGLSPAISIQQKTSGWNPRSTVGTITQIYDYLRVLFARVGRQHCPSCGKPIAAQTREHIVARLLELPAETKVVILAPKVRGQKGEYRDLFEDLLRQGFARARVDGEIVSLSDAPSLARHRRHDIEVIVDRLAIRPDARARLAEAVEQALRIGDGVLIAHILEGADLGGAEKAIEKAPGARVRRRPKSGDGGRDILLSAHYACPKCDVSFDVPSPQLFSFNSPTGMCMKCHGLGTTFDFDPDLLIPDPSKSFLDGAIEPLRKLGRWRRHIYKGAADHVGADLKKPWNTLSKRARDAMLYGLGDEHVTFSWRARGYTWRHGGTFDGAIAELRDKHRKTQSTWIRSWYEKYMRSARCNECGGARLRAQARAVRLGGRTITEIGGMAINDAQTFFDKLELGDVQRVIAADALKEVCGRLRFLCDVGLEYLTLDRAAPTLSGGESQRIRLASQIGAGLVGVLYVLDEPSIGLHARDNQRLLDSLARLRDMGNTVIVVEHDEQTMRAADHIVDFGPGPGVRGGKVVAHGDIDRIASTKGSLTGQYLRGEACIEVPARRRPVTPPSKKARPRRRAKKK